MAPPAHSRIKTLFDACSPPVNVLAAALRACPHGAKHWFGKNLGATNPTNFGKIFDFVSDGLFAQPLPLTYFQCNGITPDGQSEKLKCRSMLLPVQPNQDKLLSFLERVAVLDPFPYNEDRVLQSYVALEIDRLQAALRGPPLRPLAGSLRARSASPPPAIQLPQPLPPHTAPAGERRRRVGVSGLAQLVQVVVYVYREVSQRCFAISSRLIPSMQNDVLPQVIFADGHGRRDGLVEFRFKQPRIFDALGLPSNSQARQYEIWSLDLGKWTSAKHAEVQKLQPGQCRLYRDVTVSRFHTLDAHLADLAASHSRHLQPFPRLPSLIDHAAKIISRRSSSPALHPIAGPSEISHTRGSTKRPASPLPDSREAKRVQVALGGGDDNDNDIEFLSGEEAEQVLRSAVMRGRRVARLGPALPLDAEPMPKRIVIDLSHDGDVIDLSHDGDVVDLTAED